MLKRAQNTAFLLILMLCSWLSFYLISPQHTQESDTVVGGFDIKRALQQVTRLSAAPHYVGSEAHDSIRDYVVQQLQALGLQVEIQSTSTFSEHPVYAKVHNVIARIEGSDPDAPAVMLMSHYDSAAFESPGASDAGSGVATILEGIRAFLASTPLIRTISLC